MLVDLAEDFLSAHEGTGLNAVHLVAVSDDWVGLLGEGHAVVIHRHDQRPNHLPMLL